MGGEGAVSPAAEAVPATLPTGCDDIEGVSVAQRCRPAMRFQDVGAQGVLGGT